MRFPSDFIPSNQTISSQRFRKIPFRSFVSGINCNISTKNLSFIFMRAYTYLFMTAKPVIFFVDFYQRENRASLFLSTPDSWVAKHLNFAQVSLYNFTGYREKRRWWNNLFEILRKRAVCSETISPCDNYNLFVSKILQLKFGCICDLLR